jgi:hypothetical protein
MITFLSKNKHLEMIKLISESHLKIGLRKLSTRKTGIKREQTESHEGNEESPPLIVGVNNIQRVERKEFGPKSFNNLFCSGLNGPFVGILPSIITSIIN